MLHHAFAKGHNRLNTSIQVDLLASQIFCESVGNHYWQVHKYSAPSK